MSNPPTQHLGDANHSQVSYPTKGLNITASFAPENRPGPNAPKGNNDRIPTIHFQGLFMFVSGRKQPQVDELMNWINDPDPPKETEVKSYSERKKSPLFCTCLRISGHPPVRKQPISPHLCPIGHQKKTKKKYG